MKTYLVEGYTPDIEFDEDSAIVALTPKVCYQLDKAGIKYSIIEDYYDEIELSSHEDEYYKSQLGWISRLDEFLQKNVKELEEFDLELGTIYYYYLKTSILDPIYVRCYTFRRLFEAVKPSTIIFISEPPDETPLDFRLQSGSRSYYSQVTSILCAENGVPLTHVFLEPNSKDARVIRLKTIGRDKNIVARIKQLLSKSGTARRIYSTYGSLCGKMRFFYKCRRRLLLTEQTKQQLNIFLLKTAHMGEDFIVDALSRGYSVYLLSDGFITKYSCLGVKRYLDIRGKYESVGLDNIWEKAANLFASDDLVKWFNEKCRLDVSQIVMPKSRYFITKICPEIMGYFKVFTAFYKRERIDFVITPHEVSPVEFAAVAAANHSGDTKSVYLQHGGTVFAINYWNMMRLAHFNVDISSTEEIREYFRYQCQINHFHTKLFSSPHRLLDVRQIGFLREKRKSVKKNRIIYLPTMMRGNYGRFDCAHYPDTWYYEFQKSLIEYFSTRKEYIFVWKGIPAADVIYNPIPNFISDDNFSNIEVATTPFPQHLLEADRVICDYPSTGFYESIIAGVPTMSLCHRAFKVRESAVDYFGNLLKFYSDISEAVQHIDEFLNSEPGPYTTKIETGNETVLHNTGGAWGKTTLRLLNTLR